MPEPESKAQVNSMIGHADKEMSSLTEQNWLFIKYFLEFGSIKKAYKLAGYQGKDESAPYTLFKSLKTRIEDIGSVDIASRSRLLAEVNKLLEIPLAEDKRTVSFGERLKLLKFVKDITPEAMAPKQSFSVFVIHRHDNKVAPISGVDTSKGDLGTIPPSDSPTIIDAEPIE